MSGADGYLPLADRDDASVQGHWLLARLGKRVLRPGGLELTERLLGHAELTDADVVELAPGLGRTAAEIIARRPRSYQGIDRDPQAVRAVQPIVGAFGQVHTADAAETGLSDASADVVIGEAMLTMQGERAKTAIVAEAVRLLRPGGRYAIHELALTPADIPAPQVWAHGAVGFVERAVDTWMTTQEMAAPGSGERRPAGSRAASPTSSWPPATGARSASRSRTSSRPASRSP